MVFRSIFSNEEAVSRAVPAASEATSRAWPYLSCAAPLTCFATPAAWVLASPAKRPKSFLYLPADIFGGSADTILVHGSSFAREGRGTPRPIQRKGRPQAGGELAPILSEEAPAENRLAGGSGAGPARVRNVSLSKRLTPRGNKETRNKNLKLCRQRL